MANRRPRMRNNIEDLCYLLQTANLSSVEQLLTSGQYADAAGRDGFTPLMWSVEQGDEERFGLLLRYGANIKKTDKQLRNCLHLAVLKRRRHMVSKLCQLGIDKNAVDSDGLTPLMTSLMTEALDLTHLLIHKGVDVNTGEVCISELSALHIAVLRPECHKVIPLLIQAGADVNKTDSVGSTALVMAIKGRYADVTRTLLEHSADPNIFSPLDIAIQMVYPEGAALLLAFGADPAQDLGLNKTVAGGPSSSPFSQLIACMTSCSSSDSRYDQILESMIAEDGTSTSSGSANYILGSKGCEINDSGRNYVYLNTVIINKLLAYSLDIGTVLKHYNCKCHYTSSSVQKCKLHALGTLSIPTPLSLFVIARNKMRQCLGKGISQKAKGLEMPDSLRKNLTAKLWNETDWLMNSHK